MPDQVRHDEDGAAAVPALPVIPRGGGSRARPPRSFRRRAESMNTIVRGFVPRCSWMPDQVRHDENGATAVPALARHSGGGRNPGTPWCEASCRGVRGCRIKSGMTGDDSAVPALARHFRFLAERAPKPGREFICVREKKRRRFLFLADVREK